MNKDQFSMRIYVHVPKRHSRDNNVEIMTCGDIAL